MKVISVRKIGYADVRRILDEDDYTNTLELMYEEHGVILPDYDNIPVDKDQLRILVGKKLRLIVETYEGNLIFDFFPGFMTDYGSVPKWARGIVDNDALWMILASMVHDINFRMKFLSFDLSNKLFREMLRVAGAGWFARNTAYAAVQYSPTGKANYALPKPQYDTQARFTW